MQTMIKILAIDDNRENLISLKALITETFPDTLFFQAQNGKVGLELAAAKDPDIIFLDIFMPEMDGYEICRILKQDKLLSDIPVVFITAQKENRDIRIQAIEAGAEAFLTKPVDETVLKVQIITMLKIKKANRHIRTEHERLEHLVAERTLELKQNELKLVDTVEELRMEIESHKETELALVSSQERLKRAELASKSGNWELNLKTQKAVGSEGALNIYGVEKDELTYSFIKEIPLPEYRPLLDLAIKNLIELDQPYDIEFKIKTTNNSQIKDIHSIAFYDKEKDTVFGIIQDITERKRIEQALRESEEKYRLMFETAHEGIVVAQDYKFVYFNQKALNITGYTESELLNMPFLNIIDNDDHATLTRNYQRRIAGEKVEQIYEVRIVRKDKEIRWVTLAGARMIWNGEPATFNFINDITERKQTELLLKASEEKYRLLTENTSDVIWILNHTTGKMTFISPSIFHLRGFTVEEAMSQTLDESLTPESAKYVAESIEKKLPDFLANKLTSQTRVLSEVQQPCKDGSIIWVEIATQFQFNSAGEVEILGVSRNVDQRKKLENEIISNEKKYRLLFENSPLGIYIANTDGDVIDCNQSLLNILDSPSLEMTKKINVLKFPPLIENGYAGIFMQCLTENKTISVEMPYQSAWGKTMYLSNYVIPLTNSEGKVEKIYTLMEDITIRKQTEESLKISEASLKELNATKDKFFSIIAHDLKNPFSSIVGLSELLKEDAHDLEISEIIQYSELINTSANNTMLLLENLLEWAQMQQERVLFEPKLLVLSELVKESVSTLSFNAEQKNIQLVRKIPARLIINADKDMLKTLLRNLVNNAIKYTKSGGKVEISAIENNNEIQVSVADNGIGISKENILKLFNIGSGFSTHGTNNEKGTGLGLILCREFVLKHNGKIWIDSELGAGSTIHFTIPKN
jgi:PAS domain S-box-containing protein